MDHVVDAIVKIYILDDNTTADNTQTTEKSGRQWIERVKVFCGVFVVQCELDSHGAWVQPICSCKHELHDFHTSWSVVVGSRWEGTY